MGTGIETAPAVNATAFFDHELRFGRQSLRIMTPFAAQRAAFKKDRGPHAGTVMDRKFLYIKYSSKHNNTYAARRLKELKFFSVGPADSDRSAGRFSDM